MTIQFRLQAILHERGMTQRELALRMKIRPNTINHLCSYKVNGIYFETLEQICKTLNVSLQDLLVINDKDEFSTH
jgi:putative transcriptional regulator